MALGTLDAQESRKIADLYRRCVRNRSPEGFTRLALPGLSAVRLLSALLSTHWLP
jgi:hypothetical protein